MLADYGYTDDCPSCAAKKAGLAVSKPHSATCRKRVEARIGEDLRGKETKDRADEKWKQWAARESEKVEEAEKSASTQEKKPDETQNKSNDSEACASETMDLGGVEGKAADIPVPQHEHDEGDLKETPQPTVQAGRSSIIIRRPSGGAEGVSKHRD